MVLEIPNCVSVSKTEHQRGICSDGVVLSATSKDQKKMGMEYDVQGKALDSQSVDWHWCASSRSQDQHHFDVQITIKITKIIVFHGATSFILAEGRLSGIWKLL